MATRHVVARVDEIPPGGVKVVEAAGRSIGVFNVAGTFYALRNRCPHNGGPLCIGTIIGLATSDRPGEYDYEREGEILRCPWHGWEFDITTGRSVFDPFKMRVRSYPVEVGPASTHQNDDGTLQAETYPVEVEREVVVVVIA